MKFNFNSELSRDKGVLLFLCVRNEPMHKYLTNLDKKNSNYILYLKLIKSYIKTKFKENDSSILSC